MNINTWEEFYRRDGVTSPSYKNEWERYNRKEVADFLNWQCDLVNEYKRKDQFVTHCFMPDFHNIDQVESFRQIKKVPPKSKNKYSREKEVEKVEFFILMEKLIEKIKELAEIINNHKKIALYCGYGAKDAVKEVELLAEKLNATIAYSFRGKIFFDKPESQYTVGMNGLLGNPSGFKSLEKADVVLMLGTDFPYAEFMPKDNIIVQIDKRAEIIGRRAKVDYGYQGDIKDTLEVLLPFLNVKKDKDFLEKMHALYVEEEKKYEKPKDDAKENKLNPEDAAVLINKYASDDAIFTVDTGMTCVWAARLIKASKNRYLTGSFNHGSMANALPMAIGAAASDKNRQVIAMCGDGGLSMLLGDLATVMQYQYPIKIFVFNNRSLGMVKLEMEVSGYIDWQTNMINPPFDKIAELMNIKGIEVKNYQDLEPKIKEAMEHNGPVLVNIYTDSDTLAMPPKITFEQMRGFATTMVKKIGLGKFNEVENMVKAGIDTL
jgi:pyruvate dehydrogenase (quinone)